MSSGSFLMYRCRLCGDVFADGHAPDGKQALEVAEGTAPMPEHWFGLPPGDRTLHHDCPATPGQGVGIADLIGVVADGEER